MGKKKGRDDWVRAGLKCLGLQGIEGVRVETLAKRLGVTKGSFYWHFRDRKDLHTAMLEKWTASTTDAVIRRSESTSTDSKQRLESLVRIAIEDFDGRMEFALRDWARKEPAVAKVVEKVDVTRLGYLRRLLRESGFTALEAEARALIVYSLMLGDYLLPDVHDRFSRQRVLRGCFKLIEAS